MTITTIGLDLAKNVFQVHGVNEHGKVVLRKQIPRSQLSEFFANLPAYRIGMEACSSAHYWARTLLMAPQFVKAYVKGSKTMLLMPRPSAKPSPGRTCASFRSRTQSNRLC